ncbi:hypothetical protein [Streptosporangium sp. NPDC087985]|uniref:hypothetical protein n=1 Tax=Streptosporangium sp. NPDC087985 TaxID=3366196 RepID=UPI00381244B0
MSIDVLPDFQVLDKPSQPDHHASSGPSHRSRPMGTLSITRIRNARCQADSIESAFTFPDPMTAVLRPIMRRGPGALEHLAFGREDRHVL